MGRATVVRMKSLVALAAAAALGACTDAGTREAALQDSAMQANEQPAPAAQPVQPESVTATPTTSVRTPTTSPRPTQTEPPLRRPPPPRDTRPSIPYPPDTI